MITEHALLRVIRGREVHAIPSMGHTHGTFYPPFPRVNHYQTVPKTEPAADQVVSAWLGHGLRPRAHAFQLDDDTTGTSEKSIKAVKSS